jgi:hypothetical protein
MYAEYKAYLDHFGQMNEQWLQFYCPSLVKAKIKETEKTEKNKKG